jgi:MiaB-like tRNA modifying enzyme
MKFAYIETYGCTANKNNTEIIKGLVKTSGLEITNNPEIADIIILNTCIVKEPTEKKIESRISELLNKNKKIIIAGCMPDVRHEKLKHKNIYLISNKNIKQISSLIKSIEQGSYSKEKFLIQKNEIKLCLPKYPDKKRIGITQISEGCLGNCSFCLTRLAKGKLFSYPQEKIIQNIKSDLSAGCKEIWITSQDNANYGLDEGKRKLPKLLSMITELKGRFEIRIGMMNPENILPIIDELIELYKNKKIKKFLHIPVQSGSSLILNKMNRKYTAEDFEKIVEKFRKQIEDIVIWTDIIVGFPGETEDDFSKTLEIISKTKPDFVNVNRFWAMNGTQAQKMPQISRQIIKQRTKKLINKISSNYPN